MQILLLVALSVPATHDYGFVRAGGRLWGCPPSTHDVGFVRAGAPFWACAQNERVERDPLRTETTKLQLGGWVDLDLVFRNRALDDARGSFAVPTPGARQTNDFEGMVGLRIDAAVGDVDFSALLRTERLPSESLLEGDPDGPAPILKELNARFNRVFDDRLTLTVGAQRVAFDVRGRGSAFFFDPYNSESLAQEINQTFPQSGPDSLQPTGAVAKYVTGNTELTLAWLPAIIEGGTAKADESAAFVSWMATTAKGSRMAAILAVNAVDGGRTSMATIGAGAAVREIDGVEIYGEFYAQVGDRSEIILSGLKEGLAGVAFAFQLGVRYDHKQSWIEGNLTYLGSEHDVTDGEEGRFLSYENVNDLLIIESANYGIDLDTNLIEWKILAGTRLDERLRVWGALAFVRLSGDAPYIPSALGRNHDVGTEADIRVEWDWSRQVVIHVDAGVLAGSHLLRKVTATDEDRAGVGVIGVTVRF